ncbi:hypothetical protein GFL15_17625 [Rhizobium leguminosarum bv. viciae]|nr:hypothetical protein [Rhizobium leguminosarum bv. viciae]
MACSRELGMRALCNDNAFANHCKDIVVTLHRCKQELAMPTSHTSKGSDTSVPLNMRIKPGTRNLR